MLKKCIFAGFDTKLAQFDTKRHNSAQFDTKWTFVTYESAPVIILP